MVDAARGSVPGALVGLLGMLSAACYSGLGADPKDAPGADGEGDGADDGADDGGSGDGADDEGGGDGEPSAECLAQLAPQPLHRLTPIQYRNTVRDLFGDPELTPAYADDATVITELGVRQLRSGAESILAGRDAWTQPVFPCDTGGAADATCAQEFVETFGAKVFRRPLTQADTDWLMAVYETAVDDEQLSFADAMDVVLTAMLQAPDFVYRVEHGTPVDGAPDGVVALTGHELASRLSYLLWDTMPDPELLAAADAGMLLGDDGLREQVERMLLSERAEAKLQHFFSEWLELDGGQLHFPLEETIKDASLYPEYVPALQDAMRVEVQASVRRVFFEDGQASLERLLMDRDAYVNGSLATLYGVDGPSDDDTWQWVQLPQEQRAGLLTRAAFLTVFAAGRVQSPIRRGVYVVEEMLCSELGDPPPDVDDTPVDGSDAMDPDGNPVVRSVREEVEVRTQGATCTGCHSTINPTGFLFEHYDAIGRWQDEEVTTALPIDATGELLVGDTAGKMDGAVELSEALAASDHVKRCFAGRWVTRAFEAQLHELDDCTTADVVDNFINTGDMRELLVSIALSDAFRHANVSEVE